MPYTPPARSPVTSGTVSPTYSRLTHSGHSSPPRSPHGRPNLPRSANSSAYLQKSRRSPAYTTNNTATRAEGRRDGVEHEDGHTLNIHPSLRQSPPPVGDLTLIPPGAIMSPPDSTQNSSDDEEHGPRQRAEDFEALQDEDVRIVDTNPEAESPDQDFSPASISNSKDLRLQTLSALVIQPTLSPSARKLSQSRTATETSFFDRRGSISSHTTTDSDDEEDCDIRSSKPPLLRKKSGELVKPAIRPSSRRRHSSMPGTPTYSKAVHFDDQIEHVRHFLQVDKPIAVSAGGSPVDSHDDEHEFPFPGESTAAQVSWEIRLANFPRESFERKVMPVRLENIDLSLDENQLIGVIAVANLSFQKTVVARFTLDYWKTTSEVAAEYSHDQRYKGREDGYDMFTFNIKISDQANLETRTLLLCARYNVNGQELWDSNNGQNYQVDFVKKIKPSGTSSAIETESKPTVQLAARSIPRSRHNSNSSSRGRPLRTLDDDFSANFGDGTSSIRFRNHHLPSPSLPTTPPPIRRPNTSSSAQQFGVRYDFGASLSAALSQAQAQLGDRSGIKPKRSGAAVNNGSNRNPPMGHQPPVIGNLSRAAVPASGHESPRPEALLATKQSLDSRAYQEFVSKFCFFGSGKPSAPPNLKPIGNGTDGNHDESSPTGSTESESVREESEDTKQESIQLAVPKYVNGNQAAPRGASPSSSSATSSRSSSPTPTNSDNITPRASSPAKYGFPFPHGGRYGLISDSQHPTAIHG